ncbi:MAG: hypothetical protein M1826_002306 [Phylliscum demangeonii]|nr:MAG: hypothetical protein M1826_002306 [Phylliscum demangeonii]
MNWVLKNKEFQRMGAENFLVVSAGQTMLWTCAPDVISQITTRRIDFPKPIELYRLVNIFGVNVLSTEGAQWREHRRLAAPTFTEKNNELVWAETLDVADGMLRSWLNSKDAIATAVDEDAMRLSLHVISKAGFGKHLTWPGDTTLRGLTPDQPAKGGKMGDLEMEDGQPPPGHVLTYYGALQTMLKHILPIAAFPHGLLRYSPFNSHRVGLLAYHEWYRYMVEIMEERKQEHKHRNPSQDGMDLMGALIRSSEKAERGSRLSTEEILGNAFIYLFAGHETTSNALHFALILLAMNPRVQRALQESLDHILGDRPAAEWKFEDDVPKLLNGMAGAVMSETLRCLPSATYIIKKTRPTESQDLLIDRQRHRIPPDTMVNLSVIGAQNHPDYWPTVDPSDRDDLQKFKPERWLLHGSKPKSTSTSADADADAVDDEDLEQPASSNVASTLFHPARGSYLAFSEGARGCLGRRLAQVEVMAVLALIFRDYSVELAPIEASLVSGAQVEAMPVGGPERRQVWDTARKRADWLLKEGLESIITLKMAKGSVPLRVNVPKTRKTFCKHCKKHQQHKVTQYKAGKASLFAQGKRRYDRKQSGYGGQTKPVFKKKAKTTKKVVLRLECLECRTKAQLALKRCKHFELGGDKKTKGAALVF